MAERIAAARSTLEKKVDALRDAEARYRMLFDTNPQPMWVHDTENYAFLAVNAAAIERYGYSRDAFLVMTIPRYSRSRFDAIERDERGRTGSVTG